MKDRAVCTDFAFTSTRRASCLILLLVFMLSSSLGQTSTRDHGQWSVHSVDISVDEDLNRSIEIKSPDGTVSVVISGIDLKVFRGTAFLGDFGVNMIGELTWAPDSGSFFVTESDGGQLGFWFSTAYLVSGASAKKVNISKLPLKAFRESHLCPKVDLNNANAVALAWTHPRNRILVGVLAPATTGCEKGVMGFEVDPKTGKILTAYSRSQLKQKFPSTSSRLHY